MKIEKNEIVIVFIGGFFSALFTTMFSILMKPFDPIIVLYTILSTLGALILFNGIQKLSIIAYKRIGFWLRINNYNKKINQMANGFKNVMRTKELYITDLIELSRYLDPKIQFYKPTRASVEFFNPNAIKKSTFDVIDRMRMNGTLIYIESKRLLLLKEKMVCIKCGGEISFEDKLTFVDVKCQECGKKYRIDYNGLWQLKTKKGSSSLYIRVKPLYGLRF